MPCYQPPESEAEKNVRGHLSEGQMEAVICGLLRAAGDDEATFSLVDWDEVGVERSLVETWWAKHQEMDRRR